MDANARRVAAELKAVEARPRPLLSKIFSFFSFELCVFIASAILFSAHLILKISDEKLLNEGVALEGVITKKSVTKTTQNKGKTWYYKHSLHYRFNYQNKEYTNSNEVQERLWNKVSEGDPILLAVQSDHPERSRIKSSDVIFGIPPTLKFLSINAFVIGILSLAASLILKKFYKRKI